MSEFHHGIKGAIGTGGVRPVTISKTSFAVVIGTAPDADPAAFPANTPVMVPGDLKLAAKLDTVGDGNGTLPDAVTAVFDQFRGAIAVIRVEEGADDSETQTNVMGAIDGVTGARSGMEAIMDVTAKFGLKPRLLAAPGFTHVQTVADKLLIFANRLRAMAYIDCDGATYSEAVTYKANFGDMRAELCWPAVYNLAGREVAMSAYRLGMEIQKDNTPGEEYSASASNRIVRGISKLKHTVDYVDGDSNCIASLLNENLITTIINDDGLRLWGNLTASSDPKWQFANAVRVNDVILDAITSSLKWARDNKISRTFVEDVVDSVNNFLAQETKAGNLMGGEAWADEDLNTPDSIMAGNFYMDYDFTPPGIAQNIGVTSHFVNDYAKAVFE
ncbi:Putative prophage major tail sheath protein [Saliniradius amylolyticus]|uniref:Prophage major tail sheath protein n=1 Tax=Saliniradius amylolyticus TaxID=2183582 RepID=A0A2S2E592_9ALTE|nr:phage tail sheath C-terminal domain-containing protein [Saliniradius amylolyticus]AWL12803.1 Putative prophage major tail sheath protein [Saliniradius amylolyticus]